MEKKCQVVWLTPAGINLEICEYITRNKIQSIYVVGDKDRFYNRDAVSHIEKNITGSCLVVPKAGHLFYEDEEEDSTPSIIDAAEAMEPASEKAPAEEAPAKEAPAKEAPAEEAPAEEAAPSADYDSMKVAELKELLKAAGKPVSGKKADLIARLNE